MNKQQPALNNIIRLMGITLIACLGLQAGPVLTLTPAGGTISGTQGATVGWGFTIANSSNFLEVTSSEFCLNPVSLPFCTGSTLGTYTDIISSEFNPVVVGPTPESSSITQNYSLAMQTGAGSFKIASSAKNGSISNGEMVLTYDLFSVSPNDPSFDPNLDTISTDNFLTAAAAIAVNPQTVTPEPASFGLALVGCISGGLLFLARAKRSVCM